MPVEKGFSVHEKNPEPALRKTPFGVLRLSGGAMAAPLIQKYMRVTRPNVLG